MSKENILVASLCPHTIMQWIQSVIHAFLN